MNQKVNNSNTNKGSLGIHGTAQTIYKGPDMQGQMPHSSKTPPPPKPQK